MNAKQFLIAHGEKVALSATLLACASQLAITFGDQSIRPVITPSEIETRNTEIENVFVQGKPPIMKPVPGYLTEMKERFDRIMPIGTAPSWLTTMPDRGPGTGGLLLYIQELRAPAVKADDAFGNATLTITLPVTTRPDGRRISDGATAHWERAADGIENHAEQVGILIETHGASDTDWRPLVTKAIPQGFVSRAALAESADVLTIDGLEPWVRHYFRVRLVAKATGLDVTRPLPAKITNSVLMVAGQLVGDTDEVPWADVTEQLKAKDAKLLEKLVRPLPSPPTGIELAANEQVYLGAASEVAIVQVTSDTRFALDRITQDDPLDPTKLAAKFLVTKQFTGKTGERLWLAEPQSFKVGIGETIGGTARTVIPTLTDRGVQMVKLVTPFKVAEIKPGQLRTQYWEIREKTRPGTKGKDLDLVAKEVKTDLVVVENVNSKARVTFAKLAVVKLPTRKDSVIYPYHAADSDEAAEFRKDPSAYVQAELVPAKPKQWAPNEGPLNVVRSAHPDATDYYSTDTAYYELGDGRLVWWEPLNRKTNQDPEPAAKIDPATVPVAPPAPDLLKPPVDASPHDDPPAKPPVTAPFLPVPQRPR